MKIFDLDCLLRSKLETDHYITIHKSRYIG